MDPLNQSPSYRLLCPHERYEKEKDIKRINIKGEAVPCRVIRSSHFISDAENEKTNHLYSHKYHKECVESPSIFHSSDHPKHPLQLVYFSEVLSKYCCSCKSSLKQFYYCFICDFSLHPVCARKPTPLTIDNQKRHEHTLKYFSRRKTTLVCDVCALVDDSDYLYVCLLCDFIVHKQCVNLPYVIKVSRHGHRLGFIPNISYKESTDCGLCHAKINGNYGGYYCTKGCLYALHSRCAMRNDVCDGKELEGEPEETYENNKMFEEIADGIIMHQSHQAHQMSLNKKFHDDNKHCQACRLPLYNEGNVYRCMQYCDFIIHESCAYIPRVKQFMLHVHPLILNICKSWFQCRKCGYFSCGFAYVCPIEGCYWTIDTLCAFVCEPFDHYSHPHPLFVTYGEDTYMRCSICQSSVYQPLNCVKCNFALCFKCATTPHEVRYEHDEHLLSFSYKENDRNWCEICEEYIIPKRGFYACNECGVTLHIVCLLGRDPQMRAGDTITFTEETLQFLSNTYSSRPLCKICRRRCPYKVKIETSRKNSLCSSHCYYKL
ncbi:hypothetical protein N665_0272s0036 [Sinapis alba]|nr:hypothetical protein N665_0272s0036 [Sinapis alba]